MFISKINPRITYEYVTTQPESQYLERKSIRIKPTELADHIIAMANASGGTIVVGINNGQLDYMPLANDKRNDYLQIPANFIHPYPRLQIEEIEVGNKKILIYHVDIDVEHLYERKDNKKVFMRYGDETRELNHHEIENLKYDKDLRRFEDTPCFGFDPTEIRKSLVDHYRKRLNFKGTDEELFLSRHLARMDGQNIIYNNSFALLFSEDPDKYIPSSYIRYVRYDGNNEQSGKDFNSIKDESFRGPMPRQIELAKRFISNVLKEYIYLDMESGKFNSTLEFPEEARLEGIVNAVTHRSYNRVGMPIMIKHYDNRLEISNSGPLPSNVTVANIRQTRYSRNPRIARVLYELGYVRELNEGVKRIYSSMEETLLGDPIYKDEDNIVTLILINNVTKHTKTFPGDTYDKISKAFAGLHPKEKQIIIYIFQEGIAKAKDLEKKLNLTRASVLKYVNSLIAIGLIKKSSSADNDPSTTYTFI